jgi:type IV pilus assembly protein PilQ
MKLGDRMMIKNVRIPVVMAICVLLGPGLPAWAADPVTVIHGLAAQAAEPGAVIHLDATGELDTVHYSPQPGVWIVEMPAASWMDDAARLSAPELGIERAELSDVEEFGKRVTRLTVWLAEPAEMELVPVASGLDLRFGSLATRPSEQRAAVEEAPAAMPAADDLVRRLPTVTAVAQPQPVPAASRNLRSVIPVRSGEGVVVELRGDAALRGKPFTLDNPPRVVVDLDGVVNLERQHLFAINSELVSQVRVAQFRAAPDPVTRVVVDLKSPAGFEFEVTDSGAVLAVAAGSGPRAMIADASAGASDAASSIQFSHPEVAQAEAVDSGAVPAALFELPEEPQQVAQAVPAVAAVDSASPPAARSPFVADSKQLIERAPAAQVFNPETLTEEDFRPTEVSTQEVQFTGEPITLTLKDADIKDVLRTFSALTQLNIVLDPGVSGSVTVELRDVPWDQALDLILRINGLDYVLENNVLRVAPISKLASEKSARAAYDREQELAKPLKTVVKPLSYASAGEVSDLLTTESYLLSDRGSVVVDERTNKLIIRDVVDRVEGILRLIETLDQPTPQVVVEGRIVETTKRFARELGVDWGFHSIMDAEHGNDTGLEFPNSIEGDGRVNLARGNAGVIAFTFADILNTFNLDFLLSASELDGLLKIVSTPRVTTQNLQKATIRSGYQLPVQTIANNTVTVQYVDATLKLEVTPQITAEGTVNLMINLKKQDPDFSGAITGSVSNNVPIFTRDVETQLLVRDGGTTVIGGIYQMNDQKNQNGVPGLNKIPVLGWLFKNDLTSMRHDELLIFITPRIVKY